MFQIPKTLVNNRIVCDGYYSEYLSHRVKKRVLIEFDGCYWHSCVSSEQCRPNTNRIYNRKIYQHKKSYQFKRTILLNHGYQLKVMKECKWDK